MNKFIAILNIFLLSIFSGNALYAQYDKPDTAFTITGLWHAVELDSSTGIHYIFFPGGNLIILPNETNADAASFCTYVLDHSVYPYHLTIILVDVTAPLYILVETVDDQTIRILQCPNEDFKPAPWYDDSYSHLIRD